MQPNRLPLPLDIAIFTRSSNYLEIVHGNIVTNIVGYLHIHKTSFNPIHDMKRPGQYNMKLDMKI